MKSSEKADQKWIEGCALEDAGKIAQAITAFRKAARMGNVSAMSNLGNLLDDKIVPPRPKEAVYWYKRGARRGDDVAAWNLAMHYRNLGKQRWHVHWLQVAVKLGHPEARTAY